ncbi:MAG: HAD-IA family hydrolase [Actinomycetota bacterium]|nr:HAD-IA family hydrolase [Actinomycetota bacterium]
MSSPAMADRWATFDCYGTLIDWNLGVAEALARLWPDADRGELLECYHRVEPEVQASGPRPYREVLGLATERVAATLDRPVVGGADQALAESLPAWPPFPEVPGALRRLRDDGWRLAILSNTDPDFLAASIRAIGVPVDLAVTVAEAGSYKPAPGHWRTFRTRTHAAPDRHVHVAASVFHDIAPCAELGVRAVWINRERETSTLPRAAELTDCAALPDTLTGLVPP